MHGTMAFNMTSMRMAVGGIAVRPAPVPLAAALPCFSGLGVANRLCLHAPGATSTKYCGAVLDWSAVQAGVSLMLVYLGSRPSVDNLRGKKTT